MKSWIGPVSGFGSDQDEHSDPVRRESGHFERARASDRAADHDEAISLRDFQCRGGPHFDRVTESVKRRRMG